MRRIIFASIISFISGGVLAVIVLHPQIQNRYSMGLNQGRLNGGFEVIEFLSSSVRNDNPNEVKDLKKYLHFKDITLYAVEIDGVRTIILHDDMIRIKGSQTSIE